MKYFSEYQNKNLVKERLDVLFDRTQTNHQYRFMEFCGGHTHAFFSSGLIDMLPKQIQLVHGPGCPVCVLPSERIATAIEVFTDDPNIILCTYADLLRAPGKNKDSFLKAKARGLNVVPIYSPDDGINIALQNPNKTVIFFAIGFETTTPPTAATILKAKSLQLNNFKVYCNHVKTGPALDFILEAEKSSTHPIDGFIGPGHVATITGSDFFRPYCEKYKKPMAISGFSPLDLLDSLIELVSQVNHQDAKDTLVYTRAVKKEGNIPALAMIHEVFEDRDEFEWRGLGILKHSALKIREAFKTFDAETHYDLHIRPSTDHRNCLCANVLLGQNSPMDCRLYGKACTPESPYGPCMVSSEGACSAYFQAGKKKD